MVLSYRHAFHAGNHADVLKHLLTYHATKYMAQKPKPFWYIETHGGAAMYDLLGTHASKNREFEQGIGRLWRMPPSELPPAVAEYVDLIRSFNADGTLRNYPGSPIMARTHLRDADRMRLFELHRHCRCGLTTHATVRCYDASCTAPRRQRCAPASGSTRPKTRLSVLPDR